MSESKDYCEQFDIEEELESFFVRKPYSEDLNIPNRLLSKPHTVADLTKIYDHVPLLIVEILKLEQNQLREKQMVLHINNIKFRSCLVYGRIVGNLGDTKYFYRYLIDDGTGIMEMNVLRQMRHYEELVRLENEIKGYEVLTAAKDNKMIAPYLLRMLSFTKEQINFHNVSTGKKVLSYGKPSIFRSKISFIAFSVLNNDEICPSLEIDFKDFLIDWYTRNMT